MRLIYGTGNPAKITYMRKQIESLDIDIIGLKDVEGEIPEVKENGKTPLDNARLKAMAYYKAFKKPVFSCDSGLFFDDVPDEVQPGVHVRNVNGKHLSDEEMIKYYSGLARKYGDLVARYRNAIVLVMDEYHIYEAMEDNMAGEPFIITSVPHEKVMEGFPLNSLSVDISTGKYYNDLKENERSRESRQDGFLEFFKKVLREYR